MRAACANTTLSEAHELAVFSLPSSNRPHPLFLGHLQTPPLPLTLPKPEFFRRRQDLQRPRHPQSNAEPCHQGGLALREDEVKDTASPSASLRRRVLDGAAPAPCWLGGEEGLLWAHGGAEPSGRPNRVGAGSAVAMRVGLGDPSARQVAGLEALEASDGPRLKDSAQVSHHGDFVGGGGPV